MYTLARFDVTTHISSHLGTTTRPRRQGNDNLFLLINSPVGIRSHDP
jgi:hypothetical protein